MKISTKSENILEKSYGIIVAYKQNSTETKYLIIQSKGTNDWSFPKGHAEKNETSVEAALRELREETGISQISLIPDVSFSDKYRYKANGIWNRKQATFFVGITDNLNVKIQQEEVVNYIWSNYDDAVKILTFENQRKILSEAYSKILEIN